MQGCAYHASPLPPLDGGPALPTQVFDFDVLENLQEGACVFDASGRICRANRAVLALSGYSAQECGQLRIDALLPELAGDIDHALNAVSVLLCKDGRRLSATVLLSPLECGCRLAFLRLDSMLPRLNRALRMLLACNKALVQATSQTQLLGEICQLLVSSGGYRMAWVGQAHKDTAHTIQPLAQAGDTQGYLDQLQLSWSDTPFGRGPTGGAVRSGQTQVNHDFASNACMAPWRASARAHGFQSSIALPLGAQGGCWGALTIYSAEANAFFQAEVELLEELARDLAYGVEVLRARSDTQLLTQRFDYLSTHANDIVLLTDLDGRILEANQRALQAYGYSYSALLQLNVDALLAPRDAGALAMEPGVAGRQDEVVSEAWHRRRDGSLFPVEKSQRLIEFDGRKVLQLILRDISERRQAAQVLAASEARYRSLFEHMVEGFAYCQMLYVDDVPDDFIYLEVNGAFERLTGLSAVAGRRVSAVIPGVRTSNPELFEVYGRVAETGTPERFETYVQRLDIWFSVTVYSPESGYFIAIFDNITARKHADEKIQFLAHHDALTGLANRVLGRNRFELACAYSDRGASKVALLYLDLDNFKTVNDSLGHTQGDRLLIEVAQRLRGAVRETDTICRQGGDEFLVVLTDLLDGESIDFLANKLLEQIAAPYRLDGMELSVSASCGVAIYPDDGADFDSLFIKADTAMYQAKESGRNACCFFNPQMNSDADERLCLRGNLRQALEHGEFELYYQPQIDLKSRVVIGAEALIRWNHPLLGLVAPGRFIPLAEESGLIVPIGEWVLQQACRQAAQWHGQGLGDLVVAVNLSAVQFRRGNLEAVVQRALADSALPPQLLELELTESILIKNTDSILATVRRFKAMGIKLSIDDFGTGYSSLAYLKRFAVDKLKIDQSFIRDLSSDTGNAAIVQAIIQMARSLGLKTIAEGVEEGALLDYLQDSRCDEAQGYHIGRPMTAAAFVAFVRAHP